MEMREVINTKDKRPAITEEQLFDTCDTYVEQYGKEPSQQAIKALIGGSAGTIGPLLRAWKEKKANDEQAVLAMPEHIRDGGMTIIATWWQSIQPTINDMITAAQKLADEKVYKAEIIRQDTIAELAEQEQENDRLMLQIEEANAESQKEIDALKLQLSKSQSAYKKARTEKEEVKLKLARVEGECASLNKQISQHTTTSKADNTLKE